MIARRGVPSAMRHGRTPRLRARRGAIVFFLAVFITSCIVMGALTFDFGRLANLKAELQNSADAGAHAGAAWYANHGCVGISGYNNIRTQAITAAQLNEAMGGTPTVNSAEVGNWNPTAVPPAFTPLGSCGASVNAVRVVVQRQSGGLFMSILGVAAPMVQANAMAWACPTSGSPSCPVLAGGPSRRPVLVR